MKFNFNRLAERIRGPGLLSVVLRGAVLAVGLQVLGLGLSYITQIFLARWMGPLEYGRYVYAMAWAAFLAVPAGLGLSAASLRFLPQYLAAGEGGLARGFALFSARRVIPTGLGMALLVSGGSLWFGLNGWVYGYPLAIAAWMIPITALVSLKSEMARAMGHVVLASAPLRILRPPLLLGLAALVLTGSAYLGAVSMVSVALLALVLATALLSVLVSRALRNRTGVIEPVFTKREWMEVAFPLLLVAGFMMVLSQADLLMVGAMLGPREAGIYSISTRLSLLVGLVLGGVNVLAAPSYARLFTEGKLNEMQRLARRLAHVIFWPSLVIAAGLIVFGRDLLYFFGPSFTEGWGVLIILVVGQLVNAGAGSVGYLTELTGYQRTAAWVRGVGAALNIVLNLALIPFIGMLGAAVATSTTLVMWNVWLHIFVSRRIGVRPSIVSALRGRCEI